MANDEPAHELLIDEAFQVDLLERLEGARQHVELQFMTFEGDRAGLQVAGLLEARARAGVNIRILIDGYNSVRISDGFAIKPSRWSEVVSTRKMFAALRRAGVQVRQTNPVGPLWLNLPRRNHKKIVVIDDHCYLGGVNISDHNFAWHDFMVRMNGNLVPQVLADFDASWQGRENGDLDDLITEKELERYLHQAILGADHEVIISSPYILDLVTVRLLARAVENGVRVILLTAGRNNFWFARLAAPYLFRLLLDHGVELYQYRHFSHAKYLITDRRRVLFGSANFGYESYATMQELCTSSDDRQLVRAFVDRLFEPDKRRARKIGAQEIHPSPFSAPAARIMMRLSQRSAARKK